MHRRLRQRALLAALALSAASGCRADRESSNRTELSIFAASSLTEAFGELARRFEAEHPDVKVTLAFAGSQVLRMQLEQGAATDLFASANRAHLRALAEAGVVSQSVDFAANELALIVPRRNPAAIRAFEDLLRAQRLVVGTASVPLGAYTRQLFERTEAQFGKDFAAQLRARVVSEESNARLVLAKVVLGEADAAVVYRTDASASKSVQMVPIPRALNVQANYAVGVVSRTRHASLAARFVDFVRSDAGRATLSRHGFLTEPR